MATGDWVLVVDADERIDDRLADDILAAASNTMPTAWRLKITNIFYGVEMRFGGPDDELPVRLFRRGGARYVGRVHERLDVDGDRTLPVLEHPLFHFSHPSVAHTLGKLGPYVERQAVELAAGPKVTISTAARMVGRQLLRRGLWKQAWRDGLPGLFFVGYVVFDRLAAAARAWEIQRGTTTTTTYRRWEQSLGIWSPGSGDRPCGDPDARPGVAAE